MDSTKENDLTTLFGDDNLTVSLSPSYSSDTITLSSLGQNNTVLGSPYSVTSSLTANAFSGGFTTGTGWQNSISSQPWYTQSNTAPPKIQLDGEGADIVVNGASLVDAINSIKDRLNCLQVNPKLEAEWDQLQALGDQYRELEKQILEKQATWDRLKAMPPPDLT